jgi:hypothetical protein
MDCPRVNFSISKGPVPMASFARSSVPSVSKTAPTRLVRLNSQVFDGFFNSIVTVESSGVSMDSTMSIFDFSAFFQSSCTRS